MQDNSQNNNPINTNPIVEPVLPFIPKMNNPSNQISVGGVESGPINVEAPVVSTDLKMPEIEKVPLNDERMEVKEPKAPVSTTTVSQTNDKPIDDNKKEEDNKEDKKEGFEPKFTGHEIDPSLYSDVSNITKSASSGDPGLARTAIFILLDRLFKKGVKL